MSKENVLQNYWTGGAYNEARQKFFWFDQHQEIYMEVQEFNFTNWAIGNPGKKLTGNECVHFNCTKQPCQWEIGDCKNNHFNFICEAPLSPNYIFPSNMTRRPKLRKYPLHNNNQANRNRNFQSIMCYTVFVLIFKHCCITESLFLSSWKHTNM